MSFYYSLCWEPNKKKKKKTFKKFRQAIENRLCIEYIYKGFALVVLLIPRDFRKKKKLTFSFVKKTRLRHVLKKSPFTRISVNFN